MYPYPNHPNVLLHNVKGIQNSYCNLYICICIYITHLQSFYLFCGITFKSFCNTRLAFVKKFISSTRIETNVSMSSLFKHLLWILPCWPPPQPFDEHASHVDREYGQQNEHNGESCKHRSSSPRQ
jgi:hypothetical protein